MTHQLHIPPAWRRLDLARLHGVVLVVGSTDTGKSTLCRFLFEAQRQAGDLPALLDGDPGQTSLGPPATMTVTMAGPGTEAEGFTRRWFVGATSPLRHMLPLVSGAGRLIDAALRAGADSVIYDTTGLIDPAKGGLSLKLAKLDLLQPATVIALQRERELEMLLAPLRRSRTLQLLELEPAPGVRRRNPAERSQNRARRFARYFRDAPIISLSWAEKPVLPAPGFTSNRLLSFSDHAGFSMGLGLVAALTTGSRQVAIRTPCPHPKTAAAIRLGDLQVYPLSFRDRPLPSRR